MSLQSFLRLSGWPTASLPKRALWIFAAAVLGWGLSPTASAATPGTCGGATSQGADGPADFSTYCWIDFSGYNAAQATSAGGQAFTITLPGGSTLSFTLNVTSTNGGALNAVAAPTWSGAALGQTAFIGIPNSPALYQTVNATNNTVTLSNLVLTVGSGTVPYAIVAADAESTNGGESLSFTTDGNAWTELAAMQNGASTLFPTLTGVGTTTVTETGVAGSVGAYAFATTGSPTTISSVLVGGGLQGVAFAVKFHAVDFAITSSHTGSFDAGGTGSYTLTVSSNGPDTYSPADTITVTDTLPTGLSYVSASGSGWTCGDVGQVVTCTATNITIASGGSLPAITLNVTVANTVASSVTNTATVASNPNLDFNSANNTSSDVTTIVEPDLTTSTKDVVNTSGGSAVVGSTLQYTITLTESAGAVAANVSVADTVASTLSNVTVVSYPAGATNSSSGNNISVTGITVPASGSVTVVFTATIATGTANCTQINNTATITNPNGTTTSITPSAPTVTVNASACTGGKILYLYDGSGLNYTNLLNRTVQAGASTTADAVGGGSSFTWNMTPGVATGKSLVLPANGTVTVTLIESCTGTKTGNNRSTTVTLLNNGVAVATSPTVNVAGAGSRTYTYIIPLPATTTTVASGNALGITLTNGGAGGRNIAVYQEVGGVGSSTVSFNTTTVINVDSITAYTTNYSTTTTVPVFSPGTTVYLCVVISDPFGSYDVDPSTAPQLTLEDPTGGVQVNAQSMGSLSGSPLTLSPGTPNGGGGMDCSGTANNAVNSYEYSYTLPTAPTSKTGNWTASVEAFEGTEGTVNRTASNTFDVDVPSLLIMKTVAVTTDPVEGATRSKALPGATVQYTILVQNNGKGPADSGSLVITDPIPTNTGFYLSAATPFTFTDGSTSSGLSAPVMTFSNNGGTNYTYVPSCTRPCTDTAITNFKVTFTGGMNGKTGASAPSFSLTYDVIVQ